jgi:plastocyanin
MKRWVLLVLACVALSLLAAGCGGDDDEGGDDAQNTEQPAEGGSAGGGGGAQKEGGAGGAGGGAEVSMEGIKFNPASVTVSGGDTVTWTNNDNLGHDVTGDAFKSGGPGGLKNGDTFEHTFKKAGTFDYVCTVHPGMEGTVEVK